MLSRRNLLRLSIFGGVALATLEPARASTNYIVGAIRWDAWDAGGTFLSNNAYQDLSPAQWQARAPFCATPTSASAMTFGGCNSQATMDAEIAYAKNAGLNYWAYCWYGLPEADSNTFQNAWSLHQASTHKADVKWCILFQLSRMGTASTFSGAFSTLVGYLQQSNYQTVLSGRPLVYILIDQPTPTNFGGSFATFGTSLTAFRNACTTAGLANPYIVIMGGAAATSYSIMTTTASDAISNYTSQTVSAPGGAAYSAQITSDAAFWAAMVGTGGAVVPIVQTGWDTRPRRQNATALVGGTKSWIGSNVYVAPGTAAQIANDFTAAINFVAANATACASKAILAYSWNECDEGGSALVPTYTSGGPNHATLDAVAAVLNAN